MMKRIENIEKLIKSLVPALIDHTVSMQLATKYNKEFNSGYMCIVRQEALKELNILKEEMGIEQ